MDLLHSSAASVQIPQLVMVASGLLLVACVAAHAASASGPLRVHATNPRYFAAPSGKPVCLTGSHMWNNLQDMGETGPPPPFDWDGYLGFLDRHHHNFVRLWRWELTKWDTSANREKAPRRHFVGPHPWPRTGPANALDGKPKFDLADFDEAYFQRLRGRVQSAGRRGVYVSVMLFEGWGMQFVPGAWQAHPLHPDNNVNDVGREVDGQGLAIHTLTYPAITEVQEAYVRKVIDTVNDLDNVLFEISNENHPASTEWQYHMIRFIKDVEKGKPKQHPVGMTFQFKGGSNQTLFDSPADWISPNPTGGYRDDPPDPKNRVILSDTDHLWGIGGNQPWVWKTFVRGMNPIFMDPFDGLVLGKPFDRQWDSIRRSMGHARRLAERVDLAKMTPTRSLASSRYCLAQKGVEYIVYVPTGGKVTVDLSDAPGMLSAEWINPTTGQVMAPTPVPGGAKRAFSAPFKGDAVLHISRTEDADAKRSHGAFPLQHRVADSDGPENPHIKAVGDLDGDGRAEIIVASSAGGPLVYYDYPGWQKHVIAPSGKWSCDAAVVDMDGDGDQDVVISEWYENACVEWFENPAPEGDPARDPWIRHHIGDLRAHDLEVGDIDGDGEIELATRNQGENGDSIVLWKRTGPDAWASRVLPCPAGEGLALADLNGDGKLELVIAGRWYEATGDVMADPWQEHVFAEWPIDAVVKVADINGNGRLDVVLTRSEGHHRLSWFEAPEDPRAGAWTEHVVDDDVDYAHSLVLCDLVNDGSIDLVTAEMHQSHRKRVMVYLNLCSGEKWEKRVLAETGSHNMCVADLRGDGVLDIVGANWRGPYQPVELWEQVRPT